MRQHQGVGGEADDEPDQRPQGCAAQVEFSVIEKAKGVRRADSGPDHQADLHHAHGADTENLAGHEIRRWPDGCQKQFDHAVDFSSTTPVATSWPELIRAMNRQDARDVAGGDLAAVDLGFRFERGDLGTGPGYRDSEYLGGVAAEGLDGIDQGECLASVPSRGASVESSDCWTTT